MLQFGAGLLCLQGERTLSVEQPPRILIVEDTVEFANLVRIALRSLNVDIEHVTQGSAALQAIAASLPDLILLDIALPDMDGWRLLDALRREPLNRQREPLIIVLTGYGDPANRLMGKLQGVHGYLVKPCVPQSIREAVASALQLESDEPSSGHSTR